MPVRGQSRRSRVLGPDDPRVRRAAQGTLNEDILTASPVGIDNNGRVTLVGDDAMIGDTLFWDGTGYSPGRPLVYTSVKTSTYTAKPGELVRVNPTGGGVTIYLPLSSSARNGLTVVVKNVSVSTNTITIAISGQDMVDDDSTTTIAASYQSKTFFPIPTEMKWVIV